MTSFIIGTCNNGTKSEVLGVFYSNVFYIFIFSACIFYCFAFMNFR